MALLDDILGFVGEQFRQQNEQRQKAFQQVQRTGKLPEGFTSSLAGGMPLAGRISAEQWDKLEPAVKNKLMGVLELVQNRFHKGAELKDLLNTPFRILGLARQTSGGLKPDEYKQIAQQVPGYNRYIDKVRQMASRAQGERPFVGFRGMPESDPLLSRVMAESQLPEATAVSTRPEVAKNFASWALDAGNDRSHIAKLEFGPEALEGLLPTRRALHDESELLINPQKVKAINLQAQVKPGQGYDVNLEPPNSLIQSLLDHVLSSTGAQ